MILQLSPRSFKQARQLAVQRKVVLAGTRETVHRPRRGAFWGPDDGRTPGDGPTRRWQSV